MIAPDVSLPRFAGPLDLLLALVRRNQVQITDIPITEITKQYLDYLAQADQLDIDLGAEFAYLAATLIHIKSRSLLPVLPAAVSGPDPREDLVSQLLEHERVQQAAEFLGQKLDVSAASWTKSSIEDFLETSAPESGIENPSALNLLDILTLARRALETARTYDVVVPAESVSVEEMIQWLRDRIHGVPRLSGDVLLSEQPDRTHRVALFLGMLELARARVIGLEQDVPFSPINLSNIERHSCGATVP
jgi:segregation and condensation protein A